MSTNGLPVVIQLGRDDLPAIYQHLAGLDDIDRVQRFGQPAIDQVIQRYVDGLEFQRDAHYGVYLGLGDDRHLIGLCHLALNRDGDLAEIGVSVADNHRRAGIASRLLERAILHACNQGVAELVMYFLPYNTGLMELARQHGMRVSMGHGEGIARLAADPPTAATVATELLATLSELSDRSMRHLAEGACTSAGAWRRAVEDGAP